MKKQPNTRYFFLPVEEVTDEMLMTCYNHTMVGACCSEDGSVVVLECEADDKGEVEKCLSKLKKFTVKQAKLQRNKDNWGVVGKTKGKVK